MQQQHAAASLFFASLLALTLLGCNGAERQRREQAAVAERQLRDLVSRCRGQQPAVQQRLQELSSSEAALSQLSQQRYSPLPRPTAPDPAVLVRFTREDQELEQERYQQSLASWRQADGAERQRWETKQATRLEELTERKLQTTQSLQKLGVAANLAARTAWKRCDPQQLAEAALP